MFVFNPLRLIFMGNGPFARPSLAALLESEHSLLLVVARPDRPEGNRLKPEQGPVAALASEKGLPLAQPEDVNAPAFLAELAQMSADLLVVADFGQILSSDCLATFRLGGINIHGSLLPKYRGAAPVAWAIYNGEKETGVSVLQMTPRMDAGGVVARAATPIGDDQTAGDLEAVLEKIGAELAVKTVNALAEGPLTPEAQDPKLVTKAPKLRKEDGRIQWGRTARQVHDQVRAMLPWPGAFFERRRANGETMRIRALKTRVIDDESVGEAGTVVRSEGGDLHIQTGRGVIGLTEIQPAGKKPLEADAFLRGNPTPVGDRFF